MALSPMGTEIPVAEAHQAWLPQLLDHDDVRLARVPWLLSAATPPQKKRGFLNWDPKMNDLECKILFISGNLDMPSETRI